MYGFTVNNASGIEVLSTEFGVLQLVETHDVSVYSFFDGQAYGGNDTIITLNNNYIERPIVFVSNATTSELIFETSAVYKSGATYWDRVRVGKYPVPVGTSNVRVFVFSSGGYSSNESHGLRVWNSSGKVIFDSGLLTINRMQTITGTLAPGASTTINFSNNLGYIPILLSIFLII